MKKILSCAFLVLSMLGVTAGGLDSPKSAEMKTDITNSYCQSQETCENQRDIITTSNLKCPEDLSKEKDEDCAVDSNCNQNTNPQPALDTKSECKVTAQPALDAQSQCDATKSYVADTKSRCKQKSSGNSKSANQKNNNCASNNNVADCVSDYVKEAQEIIENKEAVDAKEVKDFCNSVENSAIKDKICSKIDLDALNKILKKYGFTLGNCKNSANVPAKTTEAQSKPQTTTQSQSATKPTTATTKPTENQNVVSVSDYEKRVVDLVNDIRLQNGLSKLKLNSELSAVARLKSQDMKDKKYFSHTSPTYGSPFDMMKKFGISYRAAGENIAMGYTTPESVVNGWMNSPGHRANILNSSFTQIGVGYVSSGHYWTQMFIG